MAEYSDQLVEALIGPGKIEMQKYNSAGALETDKIIIAHAKEGIDFSIDFEEYEDYPESTGAPLDYQTVGIKGEGSAVVRDMSVSYLNHFLGGTVVTDPTDTDLKRLSFSPSDLSGASFTAMVKFIPKASAHEDFGCTLTRCKVRVKSLKQVYKKKDPRVYEVSISLLEPPEGSPYFQIGSFSAEPAVAPSAASAAATSVTSTGATLNGTVDPNDIETIVFFEWGETTDYGNITVAAESPITTDGDTSVTAALGALTPETEYHFRVVATNIGGTVLGDDTTLTTTA